MEGQAHGLFGERQLGDRDRERMEDKSGERTFQMPE